MRIRRVVVYRDKAGEWRYRAQAFNWFRVGKSEEGFSHKAYALERVADLYPGVEVVIEGED